MAAIVTAHRTQALAAIPAPVRTYIACDRCGTLEVPGLTALTAWGLLCTLCRDDYETAHGAGEEGW